MQNRRNPPARASASKSGGDAPQADAAARAGNAPHTGAAARSNASRALAQRRRAAPARALASPSGRRAGGIRRQSAKAFPKAPGRLDCVSAVVVGLLWFALDTVITLGIGTPRFYNVYVNGVSLRGYTREEGFALFENHRAASGATRATSLYYGDYVLDVLRPPRSTPTSTRRRRIQRAWNFGHVGDMFARKAQVKSLQGEPYSPYQPISPTTRTSSPPLSLPSARRPTWSPWTRWWPRKLDGPRLVSESVTGSRLQEEDDASRTARRTC